jgi:mercuric reductase
MTLHIAVVGSGSAAFACALKAVERGARVTMIEGSDRLGGCCVNVGCVPSKILIRVAQLAEQQRHNPFDGLADHEPQLHRSLIARQQQARVDALRHAKYERLLEGQENIQLLRGWASFVDARRLQVMQPDGKPLIVEADRVLLATGSSPHIPDLPGLENTPFWTSTEALFAEQLPEHLLVMGSSVVAVELAQAYRRLGARVTLFARHTLLYREEPALGRGLREQFEKEGIEVVENAGLEAVSRDGDQFVLTGAGGQWRGDRLLVATGRRANTASLNLESAGVRTNDHGAIVVDDRLQTTADTIYAAGDCATLPQLVYVAAAAGSRAAINMTGGEARLNLDVLPAVIFTDPQVATVGWTEDQARAKGLETVSRTLSLEDVPRALANFETHGFVKMVAEASSGRLLGAQILAPEAGDMIQTAALAMHHGMTVRELADMLFPYLTMSEALKLCAQTFDKDVKKLSCCAG